MNNFTFEKQTIDIINYISNDMLNSKNPMKYFNNIYNNHLNEHETNIKKLYIFLVNILLDSIKYVNISEQINQNNNKILVKWTNNKSNYPCVFNSVNKILELNNKPKISFNLFNILYNKKEIQMSDMAKLNNWQNYFNGYFENIYKMIEIKQNNNTKEDHIKLEIIDILKYFQDGQFISLDIKHYVENNIDQCEIYDFDHLKLYFFSRSIININEKNNIIKHILIISKWIHLLNPVYKIKFAYFDCPLNKKLDFKKNDNEFNFLSSQNVNSGSSSSNNFLMIWRREEFTKVLIHELIHYLDIDVKYDDNFNKIFNYNMGKINYPILVNETVTEIQAQFLHTIYVCVNYNIKQNIGENIEQNIAKFNPINSFDIFNTLYKYEQIFSWYQFSKIMDYYGIEKFKQKHIEKKFNQSTNVFVYYILKSILTLNFASIILQLNHIANKINIKSNCNVNNCIPLVKHIKKILIKPKKIIKLINKVIKRLEFFDETLRMTVFGIKIN